MARAVHRDDACRFQHDGEPTHSGLSLVRLAAITDEGVAVGGAFDRDTATGMMPIAHRVAGVLTSWRS